MQKRKDKVLKLNNVEIVLENKKRKTEAKLLNDISFDLAKGKILAIVGESGSGKSMLANTIINLLPKNGEITNGKIELYTDNDTVELQKLKQYGRKFRSLRGNKLSMIFQDPLTALNPVYSVGDQITETLHEHYKISKKDARKKAIELLKKLGLSDSEERIDDYPHQFSGGQLQRVVIAIAMICNPEILIADEPTTALDVTIQAQILDLLSDLSRETKTSVILITHDLGVVAQKADDVIVMYAGEIVEKAPVEELFNNPKHPYTRSLMRSIPNKDEEDKLHFIQGSVPPIENFTEKECRFADRTPWIDESVHEINPKLREIETDHYVRCTCYKHFYFEEDQIDNKLLPKEIGDTILRVNKLKKYYPPNKRIFREESSTIKALDGVSFEVKKGSTIGIVGESGSGKSTIAKSIMKLHDITDGSVEIKGEDGFRNIYQMNDKEEMDFRKNVQMIFQDPYSSLNPSKTIFDSLDEPMRVHNIGNKQERIEKIKEVLQMVNLPFEFLQRYPHEFSGGQRQRIAIARALCLSPEIILLDEPVSALDLSVQAQVLNYLNEIQREKNLSYIFISHDLSVVKYLCDYIYVIHNGRFVEGGTREDIFSNPQHIYTKRLLAAIPEADVNTKEVLNKKRKQADKEFEKYYSSLDKESLKVHDLEKISNTHYVSKQGE